MTVEYVDHKVHKESLRLSVLFKGGRVFNYNNSCTRGPVAVSLISTPLLTVTQWVEGGGLQACYSSDDIIGLTKGDFNQS